MGKNDFKLDPEFAMMSKMTNEELIAKYYDIIVKYINENEDKTVVFAPDAMKRLDKVIGYIKALLREDSVNDYDIWVEPFILDPTEALIYLESASFSASPRFFWLFMELINSIDNFSSEVQENGKVRYIFGMNVMQTKNLVPAMDLN